MAHDEGVFMEAAFKRGFHHGVINLIQAVAGCLSPEVQANLEKYDAEVREWRYTRRPSFPPDPYCLTGPRGPGFLGDKRRNDAPLLLV